MQRNICYIILLVALVSCTNDTITVKNIHESKLTATHQLVINGEKRFLLDTETAPKPLYIQLTKDSSGSRILTFLNSYKNSIYFYDYTEANYIRKTFYDKQGSDAVLRCAGYYFKNMDSIYVYNMPMLEVLLTDSAGRVKDRISLKGDAFDWPLYYPQYFLSTVNPIIETEGKLLLTGQSFFSISASMINKFKFTACIDMETNQVEFHHIYPDEIYGHGSNWEGGLPTQVYPELSPNGELIHSFPASHDLYISKWNSDISATRYGGSNVAKSIRSIDRKPKETPDELIVAHYLQEDMYAAIRYDPYRNVYYRFLLQGVPDATFRTSKEKKPIIVILMDDQFNYLGETVIGTGEEWNWANSFVTHEGLNIEYIDRDIDEDYLAFKIFTVEPL